MAKQGSGRNGKGAKAVPKARGATSNGTRPRGNGNGDGRVVDASRIPSGRRRHAHAPRPEADLAMQRQTNGTLVIVGGGTEGDVVLREVSQRVGGGKLVVVTIAGSEPDETYASYEKAFRRLGVQHVFQLDARTREEARSEAKLRLLDDAVGVYFSGGDQLRLTTILGDSPIYNRVREIFETGGVVGGTSAGASVMSETMLVSGAADETHRIGSALMMAPGFGFIKDVIIDQHFAQRGRTSRLLGAVAQNPRILGIGIDERTAIVVERNRVFHVVGEGAVYALDGTDITYTNLTEEQQDRAMTVYNVVLHVLSQGDRFDLGRRVPMPAPAESVEAAQGLSRERAERADVQ